MDKQPLLEKGIILCPDFTDDFQFHQVVEALHTATRKENGCVELWVNGTGGSVTYETAICDLIQWHGKVEGVMWGECDSANGLVWATCQRRFVNRYAVLGVHSPLYKPRKSVSYTAAEFAQAADNGQFWDKRCAARYAIISNKTEGFWLEQMKAAGNGLTYITADDLVTIHAMAEWYKPAREVVNGSAHGNG